QEVAEKIRRRNLLQLSQLTERLADEILHGNLEAIQEVTAELVAVIQTENQHQKIRRELENKLALLEDQKADLIAAFNGGQGTRPSHTPGQAWGTGEADDPQTGPVTKIDATRQLQWISGRQGMGPSEVETIFSPDGTEEGVTRPYVDVYRRSFRTAETALEFEPIPLRHRQVIRQYFEAVKSME
ncbi:MAG: hypothetical protein FWC43_05685, partial [Planctomycetaceae bacterium]|nr:hypothetical protein [Planctomycetaceae bacterium]